jgi:hypothetical protein
MDKVLILYTYCENQKGNLCTNKSKENLLFFLNNGYINEEKYEFVININGKHTINIQKLKKYNLHFLELNGKNAFEGYQNILNHFSKDKYNYFIFMKDKIRGPYNLDKINVNWIEYNIQTINDINSVVISGFGSSPLGKIYKMPYIPMKFMCFNRKVLDLIIDNDLFKIHDYNPTILEEKRKNPENMLEIKLSHLVLKNNMNYISIDAKRIINLELNKIYPDFKKLQQISKQYYEYGDQYIPDRFFWSDNTMLKVFSDNIFKEKIIKEKRDSNKVKLW